MDLGKWPTVVVVGEPVTTRQADDILIRSYPWWDQFPQADDWRGRTRAIAAEYGMPAQPNRPAHGAPQAEHDAWMRETFRVWLPEFTEWCDRNGFLAMKIPSLDGIANDRITSTYRAWCDWDGTIAGQFNVGKWLGQDEIFDGFQAIAEQFPYLNMDVDLVAEDLRWRGDTSHPEGYTEAVRITVCYGSAEMTEGEVNPLVHPADWVAKQYKLDRMSEYGVSEQRLRLALATVLR